MRGRPEPRRARTCVASGLRQHWPERRSQTATASAVAPRRAPSGARRACLRRVQRTFSSSGVARSHGHDTGTGCDPWPASRFRSMSMADEAVLRAEVCLRRRACRRDFTACVWGAFPGRIALGVSTDAHALCVRVCVGVLVCVLRARAWDAEAQAQRELAKDRRGGADHCLLCDDSNLPCAAAQAICRAGLRQARKSEAAGAVCQRAWAARWRPCDTQGADWGGGHRTSAVRAGSVSASLQLTRSWPLLVAARTVFSLGGLGWGGPRLYCQSHCKVDSTLYSFCACACPLTFALLHQVSRRAYWPGHWHRASASLATPVPRRQHVFQSRRQEDERRRAMS